MKADIKYRFIGIGLVIMVVLNILLMIWIWRMQRNEHRNISKFKIEHIINKRLNLSKQQQASFKKLRREYRSEVSPEMEKIDKYRRKLYESVPHADSAAFDSLAWLVAAGHEHIAMINVRHFKKLRALLDDSQKLVFDKMMHRLANYRNRKRVKNF